MKSRTQVINLVERGARTGDATFHVDRLADDSLTITVNLRTTAGDETVTFPLPAAWADEMELVLAKLHQKALTKLGYA